MLGERDMEIIAFPNGIFFTKRGIFHFLTFGNILRVSRMTISPIFLNENETIVFRREKKLPNFESYIFKWYFKNKMPTSVVLSIDEWQLIINIAGTVLPSENDPLQKRAKIFLSTTLGDDILEFIVLEILKKINTDNAYNIEQIGENDIGKLLQNVNTNKFAGQGIRELKDFKNIFKSQILQCVNKYIRENTSNYFSGGLEYYYTWDIEMLASIIHEDEY